jgi:hypothetical protein
VKLQTRDLDRHYLVPELPTEERPPTKWPFRLRDVDTHYKPYGIFHISPR